MYHSGERENAMCNDYRGGVVPSCYTLFALAGEPWLTPGSAGTGTDLVRLNCLGITGELASIPLYRLFCRRHNRRGGQTTRLHNISRVPDRCQYPTNGFP